MPNSVVVVENLLNRACVSRNQILRSALESRLKVCLYLRTYLFSILTSTKAISRRMQTDKSGSHGPRSTRENPNGTQGRFRQPDRRDNERDNPPNHVAVPPAVPGFGFNFSNFNPGGKPPGFPPSFMMPGQTPSQPPPPGAT